MTNLTPTRQPHNPFESPNSEGPTLTIDLKHNSQEQVSIIVVHHERPEYLNMCLQSIHCMSNLNNFEVIVVDNASGPETQEYLDVLQEQGIKVVRNKENKYWSAAANQGAALADPNSRYLVFLHADTIVLSPAWLDVMINIAEARGAGIVGTQLQSYFMAHQKQEIQFVNEWCMLITRQCWEDCGPWPEEVPFVGMAFLLTYKAQLKGHKPLATNNPIVHHFKAFSTDPNLYERMVLEQTAEAVKQMQKLHR